MAIYRGPYEPARGCDGDSTGARALQSWWTGAYPGQAANLGVCNCRRIAGTSTWSLHAECRAADMGTVPYGAPAGENWPDWMWAVMDRLRLYSAELGVQLIIFRNRIWSCSQPDAGWRVHTGSNPHTGHGHVELTRQAARTLTVARLNQYMGATTNPPPTAPAKPANWTEEVIMSLPTLRRGSRGAAVRRLQGLLHAAGRRESAIDGDFGPATERAVRAFQRAAKITVDGIVGRQTHTRLIRG